MKHPGALTVKELKELAAAAQAYGPIKIYYISERGGFMAWLELTQETRIFTTALSVVSFHKWQRGNHINPTTGTCGITFQEMENGATTIYTNFWFAMAARMRMFSKK
jgi:hypothetical protein